MNPLHFLRLFALGALLLVSGCDVIDIDERREGDSGTEVEAACLDDAGTERIIIVEDVTGIRCGFCPPAATTGKNLMAQYPGRVVFVAQHAGGLAEPKSAPYNVDLRTTESEELRAQYAIQTYPNGLIDRRSYTVSGNSTAVLNYTTWPTYAAQALDQPAGCKLCVEPGFDPVTQEVLATVGVEYLLPGGPDERIVVYLTEDSLVGPQKDYAQPQNEDVLDYTHRFVMRGSFTGTFGSELGTANPAPGARFGRLFRKPLYRFNDALAPGSLGQRKLYVVAMVADGETGEIRQVAQARVPLVP